MKRKTMIVLAVGTLLAGAGGLAIAQQMHGGGPRWSREAPSAEMMGRMLDGKLAGAKAALRLTPEQERLWGPLETAVRGMAQKQMARMQERHADREKRRAEREQQRQENKDGKAAPDDRRAAQSAPADLVERIDRMAERATEGGTQLKALSEALKPLYATMSDDQKRVLADLVRQGRGRHGGWGHHGGWRRAGFEHGEGGEGRGSWHGRGPGHDGGRGERL